MIETIVTKVAHLERTSETDEVPVEWVRAQLSRALNSIPPESRDSAVLTGWRGCAVAYKHKRSDLEVTQDRLVLLLQGLRTGAATGMTREQIEALIQQAGG